MFAKSDESGGRLNSLLFKLSMSNILFRLLHNFIRHWLPAIFNTLIPSLLYYCKCHCALGFSFKFDTCDSDQLESFCYFGHCSHISNNTLIILFMYTLILIIL